MISRNKFLLLLTLMGICMLLLHISYIINVNVTVKRRKPNHNLLHGAHEEEEHHDVGVTDEGMGFRNGASGSQKDIGITLSQQQRQKDPIQQGMISDEPTGDDVSDGISTSQRQRQRQSFTSSAQETTQQAPDVESKRNAIRNAFKHVWNGYKARAWGYDDLKPISGTYHNWVSGGIGMTIIDGIDTAWIMGLMQEYQDGLKWIKESLDFNRSSSISVFECTIRVLGGLVSAFDLTQEDIFRERAREIADKLSPAFASKTGVPFAQVNLMNGRTMNTGWAAGGTILSEWTTIQLEFRRLSLITGDPKYDQYVTKVMEVFDRHDRPDGLYPTFYSNQMDKFTNNHISFGAWGDSFYEYELKQYLLTGNTEEKYLSLYKKSMDGMFSKLVKKSSPSSLTYIQEYNGQSGPNKMDHLACFMGGLLILGSDYTGKKQRDLNAGLEITRTCYETYRRSPSGLGPETSLFQGSNDFVPGAKQYLLRPETVEAIFYAWRYTHDEKYREWGWNIFQAIEKHCKTRYGYCSLANVDTSSPPKKDELHSFFLAETLKYLYLLFSPDELIPLDEFVFNTEAHPIRITKR